MAWRDLMLFRAFVIWFVILGMAFVNGALRVAVIIPALGEYPAHVISCFTLSALILLVAWPSVPWIAPASMRDAALVGGLWLALVLAFEFLAGHYLFGNPWQKPLDEYQIQRGRIWVLVLIVTTLAPIWRFTDWDGRAQVTERSRR